MLIKSLLSSSFPSVVRCFSSIEPNVLRSGDILRQTRVYSSEDVLEYSKVSQDSNPLHFEPEIARAAGFDDPLVHGMLVAALFPRIISSHFPGAIYVSQSLHFRLPVYIGDKILGEVQALNIREMKKKYLVKFSTKCLKNGELVVLDGEAMAILPTLAVFEEQSTIDRS
ncbi:(R)-specific enoyl-CoA hydratase [Mangifera indica]|uniref:(R)-specific enoyl-CoA hydratase n=1 Tax=Mangifera indica TaxID=29780 RepID=UPI001CF9F70F|nr:(R)-specific enoyl-CoA hydratase [Mangifera indica]XP_044478402.1 (R)-specific enoyl-CoA hydratase [Mangifera indica]XP_044478410.1 (R)-specific enoyl-CoA hydratase [Mangifera indica]XP_044478418.1 (R)-specific enoyl-CoA hydratase [Mangifera indica]